MREMDAKLAVLVHTRVKRGADDGDLVMDQLKWTDAGSGLLRHRVRLSLHPAGLLLLRLRRRPNLDTSPSPGKWKDVKLFLKHVDTDSRLGRLRGADDRGRRDRKAKQLQNE